MMLRSLAFAAACVGLIGLTFVAAVPSQTPAHRYEQDPPLAHTGGFDEPTCYACHFDGSLNEEGGSLVIAGVPDTYEPGETYRFAVRLHREGLERSGFELAVRFRDGTQAGSLRAVTDRATVTTAPSSEVQYAHHTPAGTEPTAPDSARWTLEWTAPSARDRPESHAPDTIAVHVAANAANGDASEFGDFIYTVQRESNASDQGE